MAVTATAICQTSRKLEKEQNWAHPSSFPETGNCLQRCRHGASFLVFIFNTDASLSNCTSLVGSLNLIKRTGINWLQEIYLILVHYQKKHAVQNELSILSLSNEKLMFFIKSIQLCNSQIKITVNAACWC